MVHLQVFYGTMAPFYSFLIALSKEDHEIRVAKFQRFES
jgi:hypothetical protein